MRRSSWLVIMSKRSWIVDLESFNVIASDEDEAIEEGYKCIREMGVKIDQVLEDPFSSDYDDSGNIVAPRDPRNKSSNEKRE